jgi:hypothetical protein
MSNDGVAVDAAEYNRFGRSAVADSAAAFEMELRRDNGRFMSLGLNRELCNSAGAKVGQLNWPTTSKVLSLFVGITTVSL